ncbi:MAG: transcription antitermination factor NusB [Eubacteriales bacterium]|nr:transcription antitermination factor NusB [Eubacteriales bacterium]MDD4326877.1 transcription antitermination factor NusB [Eubacteriales bacterium]MDD4717556.1 transcription antitermination factor NusB [Eubacteriales bacterium]
MSRKDSRESAFKFLYQLEIQKDDFDSQKILFIEEMKVKENELEYFDLLVSGVTANKSGIDSIYAGYLNKWNLDRIPKVDQTILRIATYELLHVADVPANVSISEAVLLSKKYSTDEARAYINGILGKLSADHPKKTV